MTRQFKPSQKWNAMRKIILTPFAVFALAIACHAVSVRAAAGDKDKKPAAKASAAEIEKLVKNLGSPVGKEREIAEARLLQLDGAALPALKVGMKATNLEGRRRAQTLYARIHERCIRAKATNASKYGIDVLVERMVRNDKQVTEDDWEVIDRIVQDLALQAKKFGPDIAQQLPRSDTCDGHKLSTKFGPDIKKSFHFSLSRVVLDGLETSQTIASSVVCNRGKTKAADGPVRSVILANGDVFFGGPATASVIVCDGNVRVALAEKSIIIASGKIIIRDPIGNKGNLIEDAYRSGFSMIRFFSVRDLGIQLAGDNENGLVAVSKLTDGSMLEIAGLKVGHIIRSINGRRLTTANDARGLFRRGLSDGNLVIEILGRKTPIKVEIPW